MDNSGGVVDVDVRVDKADDGRDALDLGGDVSKRLLVVENEGASQQQVFRRVARQGQLRKGNEVGAEVASAAGVLDDLRGVALEVTDRRVDLRERDS